MRSWCAAPAPPRTWSWTSDEPAGADRLRVPGRAPDVASTGGRPGHRGPADTGPRAAPGRARSDVVEAEADLHGDLNVPDLAVLQMAADLGDLEPVQAVQGLRRPVDRVADRLVDPVGRASHDLGNAIGVVAHRSPPGHSAMDGGDPLIMARHRGEGTDPPRCGRLDA